MSSPFPDAQLSSSSLHRENEKKPEYSADGWELIEPTLYIRILERQLGRNCISRVPQSQREASRMVEGVPCGCRGCSGGGGCGPDSCSTLDFELR
ncbi:hypothetical protein HPG69_009402 [Diceros bicornis minor]|uniref:Uncharacterized protein n=1 Tax=Diceros bicornis minor TaxID=77932 RepID=A0A7J7F2S9_DICBM|nr:hypothetical protein HPG69_009402 [Diceros bicornis minor]